MASCAVKGGCPSDYVAISVSLFSVILLLSKAVAPYLIHKIPRPKGSSLWLVAIQLLASFNLLLSLVMSLGFLRFRRRHWWSSCYIWAVWLEGPFGFGLMLSCRIVQAFQLYNIFVKRRLPPIRSYIFLPLVLLPWISGAAFIHMKKPLNNRCHMGAQWIIPVLCLHAMYVAALVGFTGAVRHIEFRFHELKDLWRGILVSTCSIGLFLKTCAFRKYSGKQKPKKVTLILLLAFGYFWPFFSPLAEAKAFRIQKLKVSFQKLRRTSRLLFVCVSDSIVHLWPSIVFIGIWGVAYVLNEIHEDISLVQIVSRSLLLVMTSVLVLAFFSISLSQPLVSLLSLRKRNNHGNRTMGRALGIPDSGLLSQMESTQLVDYKEPLDKLLLDKRFRQSFMEFADSCLAGESVHFYEEVKQLEKIPINDHVRRIYMARHIIDTYIAPGTIPLHETEAMEVNISHRCRQEILSTLDLAHPNLFTDALNELLHLLKLNLANDYWSSTYFMKLKEEARMKILDHELEPVGDWNFSHRLSSVHCADDPFHQEHSPRKSSSSSHDLELQ